MKISFLTIATTPSAGSNATKGWRITKSESGTNMSKKSMCWLNDCTNGGVGAIRERTEIRRLLLQRLNKLKLISQRSIYPHIDVAG
jgi:hypothetical protein